MRIYYNKERELLFCTADTENDLMHIWSMITYQCVSVIMNIPSDYANIIDIGNIIAIKDKYVFVLVDMDNYKRTIINIEELYCLSSMMMLEENNILFAGKEEYFAICDMYKKEYTKFSSGNRNTIGKVVKINDKMFVSSSWDNSIQF